MAVAGKKDPLKKQKDSLNFKNNAVQKLTPQQMQGKKTLDSIAFQRDLHKIDKAYDKKRCNEVGICSSYGTQMRRRESRIMDNQSDRAKSLVRGYKVGPNPYN